MKDLDLALDGQPLGELADAIDRSLAPDSAPAWAPAFAAADAKQKMETELTPGVLGDSARELAAADPPADGGEPAPGFLALVKGWLGRA